MKEFLKVFKFELRQMVSKKAFIISAIIVSLVFFAATFITRFGGNPNANTSGDIQQVLKENKEELGLFVKGDVHQSVLDELSKKYKVIDVSSEEEAKKLVEDKKVVESLVLESNLKGKVYSRNLAMGGVDTEITDLLKDNYKYNIAFPENGIDTAKVLEIESVYPEFDYKSLGRNGIVGYIVSYFAVMFLYFMILLNGQSISTNVAKEKSSRTMELLITNVKPKSLILGKVAAGVVGSLILFLLSILALVLGFVINVASAPGVVAILDMVKSEIRLIDVFVFLAFALVGVTMFYFIFAALGSLVSKVEDVSQALTPVMIIFIGAFMLTFMGMSNPEGSIMKIASFVPFTSPLAMFSRFVMTQTPLWEVGVSFIILVITTIFFGIVSIKIYRQGTLNYGNRLNIIKALTQKLD